MSFTCPECGRISYHPEDERQGYCGACHAFTGSPFSKPEICAGLPCCGNTPCTALFPDSQ